MRPPEVKDVVPMVWAINQLEDIGEGRFALVTLSVDGAFRCHLCKTDLCADVRSREQRIDDEDKG